MNNNPIKSFLLRLKLQPYIKSNCLYYNKLDFNENSIVIFDLSDSNYIHFGDILFYLPSIILIAKSFKVKVIANNENFSFLSHFLNNLEIIKEYEYSNSDLTVTSPYNLFKSQSIHNKIGLGLPIKAIDNMYPMYLYLKIANTLKLRSSVDIYNETLNEIKNEEINKKSTEWGAPSLLVSPFVSSGKFRDFLSLKRKRLLLKANSISEKNNIEPILVGSKIDKNMKLNFSSSYDLRGKNITDIMSIVRNKKIVSGIGFDNFWMHYFNLIGKPYELIFRGRFTKIHY